MIQDEEPRVPRRPEENERLFAGLPVRETHPLGPYTISDDGMFDQNIIIRLEHAVTDHDLQVVKAALARL